MSLFVNQSFVSHAGLKLPFKIECDPLTDDDITTLASIIGKNLKFRDVFGIPKGGVKLATALKKYSASTGPILIVDDVFTTGTSMEEARSKIGDDSIGVVVFSRGECPSWVSVVFQLSEWAGP